MQVSGLALPLAAVILLDASATDMGVLGAARWLPYLMFGLVAGVWLDRVRRRPVLVASCHRWLERATWSRPTANSN
jgi:hypothetical protein